MNTINLQFTREHTQIIKGIALIFMMILHVGGNGAYDVPISTMNDIPIIRFLHPSFKLCVGIFAFMIGYGYAFALVKDWKYSIKHIWRLLKVFWLILIVITVPSILILGKGEFIKKNGIEDFIQNLWGVSESLNWYSWFVALYIFCMFFLPFLTNWIDRKPLIFICFFVVFFYLLEVGIHALPFWKTNLWIYSLFNNCMMMPTVLLGYYFAKEHIFQKIPVLNHWLMAIGALICIALIFVLRVICGSIIGFSLDFVYVPIFVFCILIIFNICKLPIFRKVIISIGNLSVYMWFFHALFFMVNTRSFYQPWIIVSDNIFIITFWTIILTYICSYILQKSVDGIEKMLLRLK